MSGEEGKSPSGHLKMGLAALSQQLSSEDGKAALLENPQLLSTQVNHFPLKTILIQMSRESATKKDIAQSSVGSLGVN